MAKSSIFQVGKWQVLPQLNLIKQTHEQRHLEPLAIELLTYLAQRAGQVVSRAELLEQLWPKVIVSDDALTQVVIKLRKALDDNSRAPKYIKTVPKKGYCLVADVTQLNHQHKNTSSKTNSKMILALLSSIIILITIVMYKPQNTFKVESASLAEPALTTQKTTLAVLPFKTMVEGSEQQVLARSLASDLRTDLSQISSLTVVDIINVEPLTKDITYRITGDVQKNNGRLILHLNLININGEQIWSKRIDHPYDDILQTLQTISLQLVDALAVQVEESERNRIARPFTKSVQAYEFFQQAQSLLLNRDSNDNKRAQTLYWSAIEIDPEFARAYAGLALSYAADYRNQWADDGKKSLEKAKKMALTASQINPDLATNYWVLAYINTQSKQHNKAIKRLQKALTLDPSFADALALLGGIQTYIGNPQKSITLLRQAIRLRPAAGALYYLLIGRAYYFLNNLPLAQLNLKQSINRNAGNQEARLYLSLVLNKQGQHEEAQWEKDEVLALSNNHFNLSTWLSTYPMISKPQIAQLQAEMTTLGY